MTALIDQTNDGKTAIVATVHDAFLSHDHPQPQAKVEAFVDHHNPQREIENLNNVTHPTVYFGRDKTL
ncbi:MAG: hypothetical protein V7695_10600 [Sulfitobacter sp.]